MAQLKDGTAEPIKKVKKPRMKVKADKGDGDGEKKKRGRRGGGGIHKEPQKEYNKLGEAADLKGKPGPNGEDPTAGRWRFEGRKKKDGTRGPKKWSWRKYTEKDREHQARLLAKGEDPFGNTIKKA